MAEIVLAECNGNTWVVEGDQYVDDLLANTLPPSMTIRFIAVLNAAEAHRIWDRRASGDFDNTMPWMINPAIVRRIKGGLDSRTIVFSPWSAMLDADAADIIASTADWLRHHAPTRIALRQFCPDDAPAGLADLQRLRGQLVAGALARAGADAGALNQETGAPEDEGSTDRMELVTAPARG